MNNIDINAVLNSTGTKRIVRAYNDMASNYTKDTAEMFKQVYEFSELSDILRNSRKIFSEPYYGYEFYKNIILNCKIPPHCYYDEMEKIEEYLDKLDYGENLHIKSNLICIMN